MRLPTSKNLEIRNTHRLIPYPYSEKAVLDRLVGGDVDLIRDLTELDGATDKRLLAESGKLPSIRPIDLLGGFDFARVINEAFTYPGLRAGRFNGPDRGAWYAGFELQVAEAEVIFRKSKELSEVPWHDMQDISYVDYLADFNYGFHDIRHDPGFEDCLDRNDYGPSQALAAQLLHAGSAGIVFPSVRYEGGDCIACFRPPLVQNVKHGSTISFKFVNAEVVARADLGT